MRVYALSSAVIGKLLGRMFQYARLRVSVQLVPNRDRRLPNILHHAYRHSMIQHFFSQTQRYRLPPLRHSLGVLPRHARFYVNLWRDFYVCFDGQLVLNFRIRTAPVKAVKVLVRELAHLQLPSRSRAS